MLPYRSKHALRLEDYRVDSESRPGWVAGTTRVPRVGEQVLCAGGLGIVAGVTGKTGDGSRLVHIDLEGKRRHPYMAAASNVLLPPEGAVPSDAVGARVPPVGAREGFLPMVPGPLDTGARLPDASLDASVAALAGLSDPALASELAREDDAADAGAPRETPIGPT